MEPIQEPLREEDELKINAGLLPLSTLIKASPINNKSEQTDIKNSINHIYSNISGNQYEPIWRKEGVRGMACKMTN